jgi:hypothetical protein
MPAAGRLSLPCYRRMWRTYRIATSASTWNTAMKMAR